jgi:hypothetical protein
MEIVQEQGSNCQDGLKYQAHADPIVRIHALEGRNGIIERANHQNRIEILKRIFEESDEKVGNR